jgi:S-DNA-T family DNA segregation ATPase FtsK/SpoIIIE
LGKGHLAARLEGEQELIFGQVPYVESEFLSQVVAALK